MDESRQDAELQAYREHIVRAEQQAQSDFDKTVLTLSGGALGVSFAFLRDVVGSRPADATALLVVAWTAWSTSCALVLVSYFLSHLALRRTITQVDEGTIHRERPGGVFDRLTAVTNAVGGVLFVAGLVAMIIFVNANLRS